ncbi:hypothetical protein WA026_018464 [Henosepilachna vigintioctopunctata]|uniref:Timeless n=1 Tax=Henosepilachna vigintioctopunctata TaxID=420089 RepID=A0AAW1V0D5_9CUCU
MEYSDTVKIEADHKVFIDLDDGDCPEDPVVDWNLQMKRFFDKNAGVVGENNLVKVMKEYIKSITARAIHFEDIGTLKMMVEKHIEHIYWLYKDLDLRFSDTYLENMEHIITFYLNLILRFLLALKKKMKVTQSRVSDESESVIKRMSSYLLESEYHIFHVLIRQTINYSDNLVKDVLNILQSNICKQLFKNLYMHYLFSSPLTDKSDEAFCRVYIIFENWKAFEGNRQDEQINNLMTDLLGRGSECIKDNKFLTLILKPQVSVISELMRTVGCDPAITKAYFDYIKSRQKQDLEILDDIEKLALEDRGWEEEDDQDDVYNEVFKKMVGDSLKDFIDYTQNNTDVKDGQEFKSLPVEQDDEVIYCDSDSDSDVEIVSIKPSSSYGKAVNVSQRLYIQSLKTTGTIKPPKTSFLDSISIDSDKKASTIDSKKENCTSNKNLRPNPLSQVFRNAEFKSADDPKPHEVDNESHPKHDTINSGMSNQECHSRTVEQLENSNINLSSSSETESSQDLESTSNITLKSTTGQLNSSSLQDNNPIDESLRVIIENDVLTKIRTNMNDLNINISNPIENSHCHQSASPQICENEIGDTLHCSDVSCSEGLEADSCIEPLTVSSDGKAQIEESGSSISNILQKEANRKECSTILNQTNTLTENNTPTEDTQITTTNIHVCHWSKLQEQNSLVSNREREVVSQNLQTESYVDPKLQFEKKSLKDPCHSLNKDSSKSACDVNSNVSTLSLEPIISLHKEDETLIENSTLPECQSTIDETDPTSCGTKVIEVSNESNEPPMELHVLCNSNESKHVTQNSLMVSKVNDVASEKFVEKEVAITNYIHAEDVNHRSDNQVENQLYKQISLHSDEQLDLQSFPSEMQIDYPANVSSVCKINKVIDQNGKTAQTIDSVESSKSEITNSTILPEKLVRCNGTHIIKEVFKKDLTLRKGQFKLLKRRHSDSNVYESSVSNRWGADLMCEKFDFKVVHADSLSQESVHPSLVCGQSNMFLDTGQVVAPPPIDTGQSQTIAELSSPMTDPGEEPVADPVNHINQKTAQHMCSVKRTKTQSDKDELCGYPTPPGSEEDIDDTQPDPVYSKIFPTPACSTAVDCYRSDRAVFRLDSETEHDVTVDDSTTTVKDVSQIRSTDNRKDLPAETVVPDIAYNDQTMSENDFLTEEIDPRDSMVSLEEEELLERLSDEERNEENETASRNLAKSFAQIARDAVCDHDSEDSPKHTRSVHESGLNRNATPTRSKAEMSENMENLVDIAQVSENCEKRFDFYNSPTPSSKKRKRQLKDIQNAREKSQIKRRKMARKVETRIKSFDEFEADVWNRQSPIVKFAYDCDAYESDTDETTSQHSNLPNPRMESIETPTSAEKPPSPIEKHVRVNGSSMNLPPLSCSNPVPKHPPLKGILKKVEQSHSYHPLHPVDDDPTSSYVYIHVEPDPDIGRGKMRNEGSWIKVSRKSLNAYKVSRNYKKLFERYPRVCVNCVNLERKNISDSSKQLLRKTNLELSCRIDYNKGTNDHKISFLEQPAIDESSTTVNTRNPSFEIGLRPENYCFSNRWSKNASADADDVQSNYGNCEETPMKGRKRRHDPDNTKRAKPRKKKDETPNPDNSHSSDYLGRVLSQSLDCYKKQQHEAESKLSSGEARRLGLKITQFEKAIRRHNSGKPVSIDNLPVPTTVSARRTVTSADESSSPGLSSSDLKSTSSGRGQAHRNTFTTLPLETLKRGRRKNFDGSKNDQEAWNS